MKWKEKRRSLPVRLLPSFFTNYTHPLTLFPLRCQKKNFFFYIIHKCVVRRNYIPHVMCSELIEGYLYIIYTWLYTHIVAQR